MGGIKTQKKYKNSKIPKKGIGKPNKELPIYKDPNTKSEIIGNISKGQEIKWISKSICDKREWVRCDGNQQFGYIIGYEKEDECNFDINDIQESFEIKNPFTKEENIQITNEEKNLGNQALYEILNEKDDDKKDDDSYKSTEINESVNNINIESKLDENKNNEIEIFPYFDEDISKNDLILNENKKIIGEIITEKDEENKIFNQLEINEEEKENKNKLFLRTMSTIIDMIPGVNKIKSGIELITRKDIFTKEKLTKEELLMKTLGMFPGSNFFKGVNSISKINKNIKRSKTFFKSTNNINLLKENTNIPKNYAREGANRKQALKDVKRLNGIPKSNIPINKKNEQINYDKRGKYQPGKKLIYKNVNNKEEIIRDDNKGHEFPDGGVLGPHFNDEKGRHFFYNTNK